MSWLATLRVWRTALQVSRRHTRAYALVAKGEHEEALAVVSEALSLIENRDEQTYAFVESVILIDQISMGLGVPSLPRAELQAALHMLERVPLSGRSSTDATFAAWIGQLRRSMASASR